MTNDNPWGLTPIEAGVMDALCKYGCYKGAARELGVSESTVYTRLANARAKIPEGRTRMVCVLLWDRWRNAKLTGP